MLVIAMGVIHVIATFTPLINSGLETLSVGKAQAITYFSLMCGTLLIACGSLLLMLMDKTGEHSFLRLPMAFISGVVLLAGILAPCFMPHNPFAWLLCCITAVNALLYVLKKRAV